MAHANQHPLQTQSKWAPNTPAIAGRAREARQWLKSRPEKAVVVVSHGGFLHYLTEDWQDSTLYQGTFHIFSRRRYACSTFFLNSSLSLPLPASCPQLRSQLTCVI